MALNERSNSDSRTLGVDGGGSGVRAAAVRRRADGALELDGPVATRSASRGSDAAAWIVAAADAMVDALEGSTRLRFGMGMPGRKTADARGIAHALHGPVSARFCDLLEEELLRRGLSLAEPCAGLGDDGVFGCRGELLGADGALRGCRRAYFVGGGTGLAEAFVFDGRAVPFEGAPRALERAWRLTDGEATFEERLSVRGVNQRYLREGGAQSHPELGVAADEEVARRVLVRVVWDLVRLVWLREEALGVSFERVVVSQRLARILDAPAVRPLFDETLAQIAERGGDARLAERLVLSASPHAAILGAAAGAV